MRAVAVGVATFTVLVIRGALLWLVVPVAVAVWAVSVIPALVLRLCGIGAPFKPMDHIGFASQLLDAVLSRLPGLHPVAWPWHSKDDRATLIDDML